jgi:hypothetical protein
MDDLSSKFQAVADKLGKMADGIAKLENPDGNNDPVGQEVKQAVSMMFDGMKEGMGTLKEAANPQAAMDTVTQTVEDPSSSMTSSMKMK